MTTPFSPRSRRIREREVLNSTNGRADGFVDGAAPPTTTTAHARARAHPDTPTLSIDPEQTCDTQTKQTLSGRFRFPSPSPPIQLPNSLTSPTELEVEARTDFWGEVRALAEVRTASIFLARSGSMGTAEPAVPLEASVPASPGLDPQLPIFVRKTRFAAPPRGVRCREEKGKKHSARASSSSPLRFRLPRRRERGALYVTVYVLTAHPCSSAPPPPRGCVCVVFRAQRSHQVRRRCGREKDYFYRGGGKKSKDPLVRGESVFHHQRPHQEVRRPISSVFLVVHFASRPLLHLPTLLSSDFILVSSVSVTSTNNTRASASGCK